MGKYILAGLLAGLPLALVFGVYVLLRGKALVTFFKGLDESMARLSDKAMFGIVLACFLGAAFLFGALAGLVYGLLGSQVRFVALALGAAVLFSILALVSKTPLIADKIVWNFAVGGILGGLIPLISTA